MSISAVGQWLLSGIAFGSIYGLVALGFVTVYRTSGVINFTQGDFVMVGAMMSFYLWQSWHLPYPVACIVAIVAVVLLSVAIYFLVVAPLVRRSASPIMIIMATLGASIVIEMFALLAWKSYPIYGLPFTGTTLYLGDLVIQDQEIWVIGLGILLAVGLFLLNRRTRLGKSMTATATDRLGADLVGIRSGRMILWSFAISAVIGALGGVFISPLLPVTFNLGLAVALKGFIAAVLGGWGKPVGAFLGGIVIGVLENVAGGVFLAGYTDAVAFAVLLIVLWFRPSGLLGSDLVGGSK